MSDSAPDLRYRLILTALVLSGASGLVYETVWAKQLSYAMGGTTLTVSLILAAFMGGMALGSWVAGAWADRHPRCLVAYAQVELLLGLLGAVMPKVIAGVGDGYLAMAAGHEEARGLLFVVRGAIFLILLALPAVLMGATFPLACRGSLTDASQIGARLPGVYAANSVGAVLGCLVTGFYLIPKLGLSGASLMGTLLNVTAAAMGLRASRMLPPLLDASEVDDGAEEDWEDDDPLVPALPYHLLVSGFTAMAYEVAFTRTLPLALGASTYAFTLMLAAFITGIARGARVLADLPGIDARRVLAYAQLRLGATILITLPLLNLLPFGYLIVKCKLQVPFELFSFLTFLLIFPAMTYPAYHLGMVIPCAARVMSRGLDSVGSGIGRAYAANTVGNVMGALAAGLVLIPGLGVHTTFVVMALFNVMSGIGLGRFLWQPIPFRLRFTAIVGMMLVLAFPEWHPVLRVGGAFRVPRDDPDPFSLLAASVRDPVLYHRDDPDTTVVVQYALYNRPSIRYLRVAGKVDASGGKDMHTQLMLAHLPLLLHPAAKSALVIGMGSGATAGAALTHPVDHVDVAEISEGVVEAAPFFAEYNGRFWQDPRVRIVQDDARHHLGLTNRRYDVIISEPSNPWMAGIGNLYTREFFQRAAGRMTPDGLFCQWIHTYEMSDDVLKMIVRTFQNSFPNVRGFVTGAGLDLLLIGSRQPIRPAPSAVGAIFHSPSVHASLSQIGIAHPATPFLMETFDTDEARRWTGKGPIITDDRPRLEYEAPRAFYTGGIAKLPIAQFFHEPNRLWRYLLANRALGDRELMEAVDYTRGIVPLSSRKTWLAELRQRGVARPEDLEELARALAE